MVLFDDFMNGDRNETTTRTCTDYLHSSARLLRTNHLALPREGDAVMKKCSKCGELKSLDSFHKDSRQKLGVGAQCKTCKGVKGIKRTRKVIEIDAVKWTQAFCQSVTCVRCSGDADVGIYLNGVLQSIGTLDDAKTLARLGEVLCVGCALDNSPRTMKQKLRAKNRLETIETAILNTDAELERMTLLKSNNYYRKLDREARKEDNDRAEALLLDVIANKYIDRNCDDDLKERFPIVTEAKGKTIRKYEGASYDLISEGWEKEDNRCH